MNNTTPSDIYKEMRPEYFSDSETKYKIKLPRETLAFELAKISTNQKQDEFENLCRRLAEKFIVPNLIPQVGPTGGGDGKTDSETHPISTTISDRWFIPENGWDKDEKWAFAISSKAEWKGKAKGDIKKIIETKRDYTRVFFMTNQTPSSKKKKDAQDEFINEFNIDVVIIDGEWILEKIYNNDLIDLVVDSLNLSDVYKEKTSEIGPNDTSRIDRLNIIESNIINPNRYYEYDYQLVEDALEAAILSRMLEKPREEIEGKFDRVFRFCRKVNNEKQWIRCHYQKAWTYIHWYNDYESFIEEYKNLKEYISEDLSISSIELYINLLNLLRGLSTSKKCNLARFDINMKIEIDNLIILLSKYEDNKIKPCTSLIAKTYKLIQFLADSFQNGENQDEILIELSNCFSKSKIYLEYPFDCFKASIEVFGKVFPNNEEYDNLIDCIASISEKRSSELSSGEIFLKRGGDKFIAGYYQESIVYFGKAVLKLAKDEGQDGVYLALMSLAFSYKELGLMWASNNCLISASSIALKPWYENGILTDKAYRSIKELLLNEIIIGRIPYILAWNELFQVMSLQKNIKEHQGEVPINELIDSTFAVRIVNTIYSNNNLSTLPDILENQSLYMSQNSCLYNLGHIDQIIDDYKDIDNEDSLDTFFKKVASQPFREQMMYDTNLLSNKELCLSSTILGCKFLLYFEKDKELMFVAETFLAFFESFLATSLVDVFPNTESIKINILHNPIENGIKFSNTESSSEYLIEINKINLSTEARYNLRSSIDMFIADILARNFFLNNANELLEKLFKKEELSERLALIFEHRNFTVNILGDSPKTLLDDWTIGKDIKVYPFKRESPIQFVREKVISKDIIKDLNKIKHNQRQTFSVIDVDFWDKAKWKGFGPFVDDLGFGIFIAYEDGEEGKKIFDDWIKRFGIEDKEDQIRIGIIKGVDKNNPYWYRVHVGSNINKESLLQGHLSQSVYRFHEMNASSFQNIDCIIKGFNKHKSYRLCPAKIIGGNKIEPYFDRVIIKHHLHIKEAWEIGNNEIDSVVIKKNDTPVIPNNVDNAPILEVLNIKNNN
jgi:hypothetical protein